MKKKKQAKSRQVKCHICAKSVYARGLQGHLKLKHTAFLMKIQESAASRDSSGEGATRVKPINDSRQPGLTQVVPENDMKVGLPVKTKADVLNNDENHYNHIDGSAARYFKDDSKIHTKKPDNYTMRILDWIEFWMRDLKYSENSWIQFKEVEKRTPAVSLVAGTSMEVLWLIMEPENESNHMFAIRDYYISKEDQKLLFERRLQELALSRQADKPSAI